MTQERNFASQSLPHPLSLTLVLLGGALALIMALAAWNTALAQQIEGILKQLPGGVITRFTQTFDLLMPKSTTDIGSLLSGKTLIFLLLVITSIIVGFADQRSTGLLTIAGFFIVFALGDVGTVWTLIGFALLIIITYQKRLESISSQVHILTIFLLAAVYVIISMVTVLTPLKRFFEASENIPNLVKVLAYYCFLTWCNFTGWNNGLDSKRAISFVGVIILFASLTGVHPITGWPGPISLDLILSGKATWSRFLQGLIGSGYDIFTLMYMSKCELTEMKWTAKAGWFIVAALGGLSLLIPTLSNSFLRSVTNTSPDWLTSLAHLGRYAAPIVTFPLFLAGYASGLIPGQALTVAEETVAGRRFEGDPEMQYVTVPILKTKLPVSIFLVFVTVIEFLVVYVFGDAVVNILIHGFGQ